MRVCYKSTATTTTTTIAQIECKQRTFEKKSLEIFTHHLVLEITGNKNSRKLTDKCLLRVAIILYSYSYCYFFFCWLFSLKFYAKN